MYLAAVLVLTISQTPLGSPLFFAAAAAAWLAYAATLARVGRESAAPKRLLYTAFALAVAFRAPLVFPRVGHDSDMARYVWDGRIQRLGYNPFDVVPADPGLASTHDEATRRMPSARVHTPYPPGAQLFFRLVVSLRDSTRAMKLALTACDVMTMIVLWRWLAVTGRNEWLTLAYAWNPLVVLEVAHSGHIDALGALWIASSAYWLARRRTALASMAFVLAVATKLLPIVLAPLFWRRVRLTDALGATVLLFLLYAPFTSARSIPLGAVPNVVAHIRFNGPVFKALADATSATTAAGTALALGLALAGAARLLTDRSNPAAWAVPMAASLACAPVIYPWYLLYLTPFLFTTSTVPILVWTASVTPVYVVWHLSRHGGRWIVPAWTMALEFVPVAIAAAWVLSARLRRGRADGSGLTAHPGIDSGS